jgi:hypothetical protein
MKKLEKEGMVRPLGGGLKDEQWGLVQ